MNNKIIYYTECSLCGKFTIQENDLDELGLTKEQLDKMETMCDYCHKINYEVHPCEDCKRPVNEPGHKYCTTCNSRRRSNGNEYYEEY